MVATLCSSLPFVCGGKKKNQHRNVLTTATMQAAAPVIPKDWRPTFVQHVTAARGSSSSSRGGREPPSEPPNYNIPPNIFMEVPGVKVRRAEPWPSCSQWKIQPLVLMDFIQEFSLGMSIHDFPGNWESSPTPEMMSFLLTFPTSKQPYSRILAFSSHTR